MNGEWLIKTITGSGDKGFCDGLNDQARFNCPTGLCLGPYGGTQFTCLTSTKVQILTPEGSCADILVADFSNHAIRILRKQVCASFSRSYVACQQLVKHVSMQLV
jgi:hypothetical protein